MQLGLHVQGERAQLTLHVFDIELLLDLLRNPAYKAQQVFEKLVAGNMVTGVQVGILLPLAIGTSLPFYFGSPCTPGSLNSLHPVYISMNCMSLPAADNPCTPECCLLGLFIAHGKGGAPSSGAQGPSNAGKDA